MRIEGHHKSVVEHWLKGNSLFVSITHLSTDQASITLFLFNMVPPFNGEAKATAISVGLF